MNILHVIASVDPRDGGPIQGIVDQAEVLARADNPGGPVRTAIASLDPPEAEWIAACRVPTFALGASGRDVRRPSIRGNLLRRYRYAPGFVPWLKAHAADYDAVVVNGLWNYSAFAAARVLSGGAVPYFVFPHGMMDPWFRRAYPLKHALKQGLWLAGEGRLIAGAEAVLFTSEEERRQARGVFRGYGGYREHVVGYGTTEPPPATPRQTAAFHAAVPAVAGRRFLLFLSRLHPKKGCDLLLDAFVSTACARADIDLVVAGPDHAGLKVRLQARAEALGIAGRVHWPGMLTGDTKWGAFRAADAFVLPSHQENFGIVVAEAMACGTPVLISDKVNVWREVEASGGGLIGADTAAGVADVLGRWLALDDRAKTQMRQSARAGFAAHFDMVKAARELMRVIEAAYARRGFRTSEVAGNAA